MERNIITWSPENWITVTLMAVVGFAALGLISQAIIKVRGNKAEG